MGVPCGDENAHGIPFEAIALSPSHAGGKRKRKLCGATSVAKVPTHGFSAKKEGVWHDLSKEKCRLADFWQKRKVGGATLAGKSANTRIFGENRNCVARPPEILYFFVYQYRLNAP